MHPRQRHVRTPMLRMLRRLTLLAALAAAAFAAQPAAPPVKDRLADYTPVRLTTDLSQLTPAERRMLPLLIDAARAMDDGFWMQTYGNRDSLLRAIGDPAVKRFAEINYGPWDRLRE